MRTTTDSMLITGMELTFVRDVPGFKNARKFMLEPLGDDQGSVFGRMRCHDSVHMQESVAIDNLTLLVVVPGILWPSYAIVLDDGVVDALKLSHQEEVMLLAIVHPRDPLSQSTANLYSPIVVNRRDGSAIQFIPPITEQEMGWSLCTAFPLEGED